MFFWDVEELVDVVSIGRFGEGFFDVFRFPSRGTCDNERDC